MQPSNNYAQTFESTKIKHVLKTHSGMFTCTTLVSVLVKKNTGLWFDFLGQRRERSTRGMTVRALVGISQEVPLDNGGLDHCTPQLAKLEVSMESLESLSNGISAYSLESLSFFLKID